jgi:hypothetical protein
MNPAENWQTNAAPALPAPETAVAPEAIPMLGHKNPTLAFLLSGFPGMGHVYNGLYMRGLVFFLIILSLIGIVDSDGPDLFGFAIAFFWIFNMLDAYRQATLINYGYAQDLGLVDLPRHPRASQGGLAAGVLLFFIGLFAILERYFTVRLDWLFDLWPFALVLLGGWMIWASLRDRRRVETGEG